MMQRLLFVHVVDDVGGDHSANIAYLDAEH